ncbi:MAG: hypothetical protein ACRDJX_10060 [Solirubrobacteraceae bacterium]
MTVPKPAPVEIEDGVIKDARLRHERRRRRVALVVAQGNSLSRRIEVLRHLTAHVRRAS